MTSKERFYRTINRESVDRPAVWLGIPTPEALPKLFEYFSVNSEDELRMKLGDDVYPVELPYHSPKSNVIYDAFKFSKKSSVGNDERSLTAPGFFEDYDKPSDVDKFDWPDPSKYIDKDECKSIVMRAPKDKAVLGVIWSVHFQDACAAFGMETALVNMLSNPEMYVAVSNRIEEFYLKANEIFYEATKGMLDAVLIGNDLGSQAGLIISPELVRKYVIPGTKKLIEQAKSYGLKVIYHSCGAIFDIIPDLIAAGADAIHPIQVLAHGMDAKNLKESFGDKVSFCGGVDTQHLLVNGNPAEVAMKIAELKTLFPTGLIISPSHEAILPDVKPENIEAIFEAVKAKM